VHLFFVGNNVVLARTPTYLAAKDPLSTNYIYTNEKTRRIYDIQGQGG
jgi:hypothetical protein